MSTIKKIQRKKGTSYLIRISRNGKEQTLNISDWKEPEMFGLSAAQKLKYVKQRAHEFEFGKAKSGNLSLAELWQVYQNARQNEIDLKDHRHRWGLFVSHAGKSTKLADITRQNIRNFRDDLLRVRLERETTLDADKWQEKCRRGVNVDLRYIRSILNWSVQEEYTDNIIIFKGLFYKAPDLEIKVLTPEQERLFYHNLPKFSQCRNKPYSGARLAWLIMSYSGLRNSEVLRIEWEDVPGRMFKLGKSKDGQYNYALIYKKLYRLLSMLNRDGKYSGKIIPFDATYLYHRFRFALDKAGLEHIKRPVHLLRHTFSTKIIKAQDLDTARRLLRQKDAKTTKIYDHVELTEYLSSLDEIDINLRR